MDKYKVGIDIGSTTVKMVALRAGDGAVVLTDYCRHSARIRECLRELLGTLHAQLGEVRLDICLTGSVGMGVSERLGLPFVQEVVAAAAYLRVHHPDVATMIDIGGEDAKMVFLRDGQPADLRMNGNCAGGTGAFIDQMAILLGVSPSELGELAGRAGRTYPIASRCGVFCKTDIQNLIARNVPREDIAASIFHAVAVQTVVTLAHGHDIAAPVLLCGGPLTFIPALRAAFADYLQLSPEGFVLPEGAHLIPAWGAALSAEGGGVSAPELLRRFEASESHATGQEAEALPPLFADEAEHAAWREKMVRRAVERVPLSPGRVEAFIGIDSGSTTTKVVALDRKGRMLFSHYGDNHGNPVKAVGEALAELSRRCDEAGTELSVVGSCSTGYGEDLVKAAFRMGEGIVETMAHFIAARHVDPEVSFILDIGGQDMKALFVENGVIRRIEVNEACSSGCGSFISTFASSLGCGVDEFAGAACLASRPCDLGTRCTVFMNSKVKQVLREGASVPDIAAGLSYSVVKNCLYKVLRLKDSSELGGHVVVQGGTMRNDSVVRALERLTGCSVFRSDCPELMGAWGCALHASQAEVGEAVRLQDMLASARYDSRQQSCHGCENQCAVTRYRFEGGNTYYSGNRCEKVFNNKGGASDPGPNAYERKRALLFGRGEQPELPRLTVGVPRCLGMYEEYPFWHALLTASGIRVLLSEVSDFGHYEQCAAKVMSDNICFPAKLVHSHIDYLQRNGADRILMPFVVYEKPDRRMQNSYNCPVVSGYSQVVRSVQADVPLDTPTVSFKDRSALRRQCREYLAGLGVETATARRAFDRAWAAQEQYERDVAACNEELLAGARAEGRLVVVLAGRPYHADALIQHKAAEMVAAQGACVLTEDVARGREEALQGVQYLSQWAFANRIMKAAQWAAWQNGGVQFMQLTSFGCGPDAFLADEAQALLRRHGKNLTLLKIDDVNNIGSLKLRVRSLIESLRLSNHGSRPTATVAPSLPPFTAEAARRKILVPFFTPFISPLIPALMRQAGYDADNLPMSDAASCDLGLQFSNNEVCYPATLIVGDIVKAFRSGAYDPDNTCVAISQTGGQCRASNYLSLIRKALIENGYVHTPVVSVSFGSGIETEQPGFKVSWRRMLPMILASVLYSDAIAKLYYATVVREAVPGEAARLRDRYLSAAAEVIAHGRPAALYDLLAEAVDAFMPVCRPGHRPRVGIVGEIFLKFHPFAQRHVTDWLVERNIEIVYPSLIDFFLQGFVNARENKHARLGLRWLPAFAIDWLYGLVQRQMDRVNAIGAKFPHFVPFDNIFEKAAFARPAITLGAQFGEGWLIAGEVGSLVAQGVTHVVSLQPFGCIANHIVEKGIENRLCALHPGLNILSLDFDGSVSDVNITNRLLLFIANLK